MIAADERQPAARGCIRCGDTAEGRRLGHAARRQSKQLDHRVDHAVVAIVFFCFVYRGARAVNAFEDRVPDVVSMAPAGELSVSSTRAPGLRSDAPHLT